MLVLISKVKKFALASLKLPLGTSHSVCSGLLVVCLDLSVCDISEYLGVVCKDHGCALYLVRQVVYGDEKNALGDATFHVS